MQHDQSACGQHVLALCHSAPRMHIIGCFTSCGSVEVANTDLLAEQLTGKCLTGLMPLRWLEREGVILQLTSLRK